MNFLPGWGPPLRGTGGDGGFIPMTSISLIASSTSTGVTITAPASINAGDLLVLVDWADGSFSTPGSVVPPGFTAILNVTSGTPIRLISSYKIADGTEDASSITGMSGDDMGKVLLQFRGNIAGDFVEALDIAGVVEFGDPPSQLINASAGTPSLIVIGAFASDSFDALSSDSFTPVEDGEVTPADYMAVKYKIYDSVPADVTADMGEDALFNTLASFYLHFGVAA